MKEKVVYHYSRGCTDPVMGLAASEEGEIPACCREFIPSLGRPGGFYGEDELGRIDILPTVCRCGNHTIGGRSISGRDLATGVGAGDIYITEH